MLMRDLKSVSSCKFCDLISGKVHSYKVFEDDAAVAFLDQSPVFKGHTLFVPRKHCSDLYDLDDAENSKFFADLKIVARGVELGTKSDGTLVLENNRVSQSVPHLHFHIIPRKFGDGMKGFLWPRVRYKDEDEIEAVRARIESNIEGILHSR